MSINFPIYAHIYNRGVDGRSLFSSDKDRSRFMLTMRVVLLRKAEQLSYILRKREKELLDSIRQKRLTEIYGPPIVDILAFCLMPNHYHILVRSTEKKYIAKFAQRLGNSYTRYFNTKYKRKGRLFESKYQTVFVETDEQLLHLNRYIHTNPSNSSQLQLTAAQLKTYLWSSLPAYLKGESKMCDINPVLHFFKSAKSFWEFTKAGIRKREKLDTSLLIDSVPHTSDV